MTKDWFDFQEKIAEHFRSLGVQAETNKTIKGVRTEHDLDVYVTSKYLCTNIKWVIEAKFWKTKIPKEKVLALRTIVDDIGADRGFLISEEGFQSGAIEAAKNTNIELLTFEKFIEITSDTLHKTILDSFRVRIRLISLRYYGHSKKIRIKYGLREDLLEYPIKFSGNLLFKLLFEVINEAEKGNFPIKFEKYMEEYKGYESVANFNELIHWLNLNLNWLDEKILHSEIMMQKNQEFSPNCGEVNLEFLSLLKLSTMSD